MKLKVSIIKALTIRDDKSPLNTCAILPTAANTDRLSANQQGMTLLEMLVALAVVSIVFMVVAPNVQTIVSKNRTVSEINELSSVIQFARFTAIDQASSVIVCPSADYESCSNNWNQPKIVFIDSNANNTRDSAEPLLMSTTSIDGGNAMTGPSTSISFSDSGSTNASAGNNMSIIICPSSGDAKAARTININGQGRVRLGRDSNNNGTVEDTQGNEISCR